MKIEIYESIKTIFFSIVGTSLALLIYYLIGGFAI